MTPGKLVPPYPVERCAGAHCHRELVGDVAVFLFSDGNGKLYCLCEQCSDKVQLNPDSPVRLVAL